MTKAQKILLVVGIVGVAIGGFVLTKYLTRNIYMYRYGSYKVVEYTEPPISSNDIE
jgi:hypothetical protein